MDHPISGTSQLIIGLLNQKSKNITIGIPSNTKFEVNIDMHVGDAPSGLYTFACAETEETK